MRRSDRVNATVRRPSWELPAQAEAPECESDMQLSSRGAIPAQRKARAGQHRREVDPPRAPSSARPSPMPPPTCLTSFTIPSRPEQSQRTRYRGLHSR